MMRALAVGFVFALVLGSAAHAADVGVIPTKLIVVDKLTAAGKAKTVYVSKDQAAGITKGLGTDPTQITVRFDVVYGIGSTAGAFTLPAGASNGTDGWLVNKPTVAKYVNKDAPSGPTQAKVGVVKPGKLLKLVGKGLGDEPLDILAAGDPGVGGVRTAYCVTNGGEETCHCSAFTGCAYKLIANDTGAKLVCKTGTADPACVAASPPATDPCDSSGVFVSASAGSDESPTGSRAEPVQTIGQGILLAESLGVASVCVSGEVYGEAVEMKSGISVYGEYDHTAGFVRSPSAITTVTAPGVVFTATQIDVDTHIDRLTIQATAPTANGESATGILLSGGSGTLTVSNDVIEVASGAAGEAGSDGATHVPASSGNTGANGCQGPGCGAGAPQTACAEFGGHGGNGGYNNGNGGPGFPGSGNAPGGSGGIASGACFLQSGPGGPGGPGSNGVAQGTPGTGGASIGSASASGYVPAAGGDGVSGSNGKGGSGGGGGGGGSCQLAGFCTCNQDTGGGGGSGGCGGLGGNPGAGGSGGGGSFGIFAAGGKLVVVGTTITTGDGGNGGSGGNGSAGQQGGSGGPGGAANDDSGAGGPGGPGGTGANGGPGGGGGGGASACIARTAAVVLGWDGDACTFGAPGAGGAGGSNPSNSFGGSGANGVAMDDLLLN